MCKASYDQSTLSIGNGDDDENAVVLVVGGRGGTGKEAALLTNRPHQTTAVHGNRRGQWRWQQLSPMLEERPNRPGLLLLGRERVLVCGGVRGGFFHRWSFLFGHSSEIINLSAEILQPPRDDNEKGVWTLITQPMSRRFGETFLVKFNRRVIGVGDLPISYIIFISKTALVFT